MCYPQILNNKICQLRRSRLETFLHIWSRTHGATFQAQLLVKCVNNTTVWFYFRFSNLDNLQ